MSLDTHRLTIGLALTLSLGLSTAAASTGTRWVKASPLLVRAAAHADAPVVDRLQQGSRVVLVDEDPASGYCQVNTRWDRVGFVACRYLSPSEVGPRRAGQDGVPADTRWVAGSGLVLRSAPGPEAPALARLPLNTELTLQAAATGGYCQVQTVSSPQQASLSGFTACRYLAETPLALERLAESQGPDGKPNPDFDPRKAFAIQPSWDNLGRFQRWRGLSCDDATSCAAMASDAELGAIRRQLHGQTVARRDTPADWPVWTPEALRSHFNVQAPDSGNAPSAALWRALPLPPARPSWWRSADELASPAESLAQLATRFDAQQQWFVGALYADDPKLATARVERLDKKLHRLDLLSDGSVRGQIHTPQRVNHEWLPDIDFMCQNWSGPGFAFGDMDAATRKRNGFDPVAAPGLRRLFWLHSSRALPTGPARSERHVIALDRKTTGFTQAEVRQLDLDADGIADLVWVEAIGRGPGHLGDPPTHDDPWFRLLLLNLNGQWRLLATDTLSYGCGC